MKNLSIFSSSSSSSSNLQYDYKSIYNHVKELSFLGITNQSDKKLIRKKIRGFLDNIQKNSNALTGAQKKELKQFLQIISLDINQAKIILENKYNINLSTVKKPTVKKPTVKKAATTQEIIK